ncbi:MAG: carboxymuconolactone decarboxylase family protein [Planctomycetota bacterium]|nr:carboxymuconolactone decarboxylase family protein [Planctomycetota bacterium]MDA1106447.1 carboxymuconolactone decarboxylase family protein [Planctomycetota bacterium]
MPRLTTVDPTGHAAFAGGVPPINIFKGMAANEEVFKGFLGFMGAIKASKALTDAELEVVALAAAQDMGCQYCLAAHTKIGAGVGLDADRSMAIRQGRGANAREQALIDFTRSVINSKGYISDAQLASFRAAGFDDRAAIAAMAEVTAMTFTGLYNHVHQTEVDFPAAPALA